MFTEDDLTPLSALQHVLFCERQYALIHLEQLWEENLFTAEGKVLHERVDVERHESRKLFKQEFAMSVRSLEHGLIGKTDLVEIHLKPEGGVFSAVPVEFKRGKNKEEDVDRVQLMAQALCLEEMFRVPVPFGQFYYLGEHRRTTLDFSGELRAKTLGLIARIQELRSKGKTPPAHYEARKCDRCSLFDLCMPRSAGNGSKNVAKYIASQVQSLRREESP